MWYPATVTVEPSTEPVTLDQAKQQCGVSGTDSDDALTRLISSERGYVEKYCAIKIVTQTVTVKCDGFADFERLPVAPVQSIPSISYVDVDGATQTLQNTVYEVRTDGIDTGIVLKFGQAWPSIQRGSRITVTAVLGFAAVPPDIASAMLLRVGRLFSIARTDPYLKRRQVEGVGYREWDTTGTMDVALRKACDDLLENYRSWAAL